jgi:hypothetical protein
VVRYQTRPRMTCMSWAVVSGSTMAAQRPLRERRRRRQRRRRTVAGWSVGCSAVEGPVDMLLVAIKPALVVRDDTCSPTRFRRDALPAARLVVVAA